MSTSKAGRSNNSPPCSGISLCQETGMARKRTEIKAIRSDVAIYPIGVAAKLLNVHPRTLRIYEKEGLVLPTLVGNRRMFSADDIQWITCLRTFIHEEGISIPGLKKLLAYVPCWEVAGCPTSIHHHCNAQVDRAVPRTLHPVGDVAASMEAKEQDRQKKGVPGQKKKLSSSG
jgi:MerR family transcriptional regulator/heat shock protein HspR